MIVPSATVCSRRALRLAALRLGIALFSAGLAVVAGNAQSVDLSKMNTIGDLQGGLEEAERLLGYMVTRQDGTTG